MLASIDRFRSLSPEERLNFRVGRRIGVYTMLDDLYESPKRVVVEQVIQRLGRDGGEVNEEKIYRLTQRFI